MLWLILSWLFYFFIHSLFASNRIKAKVAAHYPDVFRNYRVLYNLLACVLLIPPLYFSYVLPSEMLWAWSGIWGLLADVIALLAVLGFVYTLRDYDIKAFLGISDQGNAEGNSALKIGIFHRFVRHPWYSFAIVIIWTRDMDVAFLITSLLVSGYFFVGSRLEEKKLFAEFGSAYETYMKYVPGLLPRPWRYMDKNDVKRISSIGESPKRT